MGLLESTAMFFLLIKTGAAIKMKAESIGLDKIKSMVKNGESIVAMYLNESSEEKKAEKRQEASLLIEAGITPEMLWEEVTLQMPELGSIIEGKINYIKSELKRIEAFIKGEE